MIERWILSYQELLTGAGASEELAVFIENATVILVTIGLATGDDFRKLGEIGTNSGD